MTARKLTARITYLEMTARPSRHVPMPTRPRLALIKAEEMPPAFYRWLYEQVGKDHHWFLRRAMDDDALKAVIHAETTAIHVLYANGSPAGFFELDTSRMPEEVELAYFGLTRDFTGIGLGRWFLATAIQAAWDYKPSRVTVHTNTLDHPAALPLYQKMGFTPVGVGEEEIEAWD